MSLNRDQWMAMWKHIKKIESQITGNTFLPTVHRQRILNEVHRIKELIQSVIGQLE